jgi:hypothetical protein
MHIVSGSNVCRSVKQVSIHVLHILHLTSRSKVHTLRLDLYTLRNRVLHTSTSQHRARISINLCAKFREQCFRRRYHVHSKECCSYVAIRVLCYTSSMHTLQKLVCLLHVVCYAAK